MTDSGRADHPTPNTQHQDNPSQNPDIPCSVLLCQCHHKLVKSTTILQSQCRRPARPGLHCAGRAKGGTAATSREREMTACLGLLSFVPICCTIELLLGRPKTTQLLTPDRESTADQSLVGEPMSLIGVTYKSRNGPKVLWDNGLAPCKGLSVVLV